jgi:Na+/H+ antiporter NhaC
MAIHTENPQENLPTGKKMNGWLALSPLLVFLLVYLVSSIVARDFYKVPVAAAFIIASAYAMLITRSVKKTDDKISIFSAGAGNRNVLLMIWIFVLAGAFAATAKDIGAIDATVNATLRILPGKLIFAGIFLAACFISMAIGTSVGTIVALVPIAAGIAAETGVGVPLMTAVIIGGAFFGDNLSFISDTTVAATKTQGCSMRDKFRANLWIAAPAALLVTVLYVVMGLKVEAAPAVQDVQVIAVPDKQYGEEICACVILKEGQALTEDELKAYVRSHMARHKVPRYVQFMDAFPMNAAGKILKYKMREYAAEHFGLNA